MHLDSLKIQNFRLLEDVEVKKLGHVNLIVGKNNSGKSTVLEALTLLASGFERKAVFDIANNRDDIKHVITEDRRPRDTRVAFENFFSGREYPKEDESYLFIGNEDKKYIKIKHVYYEDIETQSKVGDNIFIKTEQKVIRKKEAIDLILAENLSSGLEVHISNSKPKIVGLEEDDNLSYRRPASFEKLLPHSFIASQVNSITDLAREWDKLVFTEHEALIVEILKIIEPNIESLAFISDDYAHKRFELNNRAINGEDIRVPYIKILDKEGRVPLHSMGDGVIRLLQIILRIFNAQNGFLLIDEFENGLHYSIQAEVWRLIFELSKQLNIQVFATTHSWDCIESFAQVAKEREDLEGVLFRMGRSVRKSDNGKVIATEFDEDELYNLTKDKIEVR